MLGIETNTVTEVTMFRTIKHAPTVPDRATEAAKEAQRAAAKALRKGTRTLPGAHDRSGGTKWVVALAVLACAAAVAFVVWIRLPHQKEPDQTTHPPHKPEGLAGGMSP